MAKRAERTSGVNDVITDRRDIDEFKEASRMIGRTLVVMIRVLMLQSLSLIPAIL
jgi:hypothetical protein